MSEQFKKRFEAYEKGELTGQELKLFEQELERLESYQSILEQDTSESSDPKLTKQQQKIMKKSKWKARLQTAFTVLGLFIAFTIVSSIFTIVYYSWGNPDRSDVYRDIVDYTLTISNPYGYLGGTSTQGKAYFNMEATRDLRKRVGKETIKVGDLNVKFIFSLMSYPEINEIGRTGQTRPHFYHPVSLESNNSNWDRLEKLPEGTVVSAYISFAELMETKVVERAFSDKEIDLLWLAVDTGVESNSGFIDKPIGFPRSPIWHDDDMIEDAPEVQSEGFGRKIVSWSSSSPSYRQGDQQVLHQQFMKTLSFLQKYESKANKLVLGRLNLTERIDYMNEHGILHYGAVITGPTKEVLKLQNEPWINDLTIDEVELWNW